MVYKLVCTCFVSELLYILSYLVIPLLKYIYRGAQADDDDDFPGERISCDDIYFGCGI